MKNKFYQTYLGLYLPDGPQIVPGKAIRYAEYLGKKVRILSFYFAWGSGNRKLDLIGIEKVLKDGFIPMITWEPWKWPQELLETAKPQDQPDFALSEILRGRYDDYITEWAYDLKQLSIPIFFRPMHEMNGYWYPWCGTVNGNRPEEYVKAWHYIRSTFREAGNDRLLWVWSPYVHSFLDESGNEIWRYYPGPEAVDWLALDGYNWGNTQGWSTWQSFKEIFGEGYNTLIRLGSEKPFMVAEIGCAEEGGDKGKWIEEAFQLLKEKFPKIEAFIWFNINKECDWRIESSLQSLKAFRRGLKNWIS